MLKQIVIQLKDQFNEEYEKFLDDKRDQIYLIAERNQKIKDLLENLQQEGELFQPVTHPLEDPESLLKVDES